MLRYAIRRVLWMVPALVGITLLTFVVLDLGPLDRAQREASRDLDRADAARRAETVRRLQARYGMVDENGERVSVWERYARWVGHALRFDFASDGESASAFGARFREALVVTVLLGTLAVGIALLLGTALGCWLGLRTGGASDRTVSAALLAGYALPEFLIGSLLLLLLGGGLFEGVLPSGSLRDPASHDWSLAARLADLARHLVLPVATLTIAPLAIVARHVRDAVARAAHADFARALHDWGAPQRQVARRVLRHGLAPVATLLGTLLPTVVAGSIVVEQTFALPGIGRMMFQAVLDKDVGVVMAITLLGSVTALVALLVSDLAHRFIDPRVELR